ncbi:hypothetical protein IEE83_09250 [Dyadobacter sp. UP-52]|uniref:Uncharacterized protein n=1 Tax=Dyadobacter subterraneus TaxID=2773304 RepID=A0ABR9WCG6_9BACT|nr:hypothetical protein [Dyadobacter subterraneus]
MKPVEKKIDAVAAAHSDHSQTERFEPSKGELLGCLSHHPGPAALEKGKFLKDLCGQAASLILKGSLAVRIKSVKHKQLSLSG